MGKQHTNPEIEQLSKEDAPFQKPDRKIEVEYQSSEIGEMVVYVDTLDSTAGIKENDELETHNRTFKFGTFNGQDVITLEAGFSDNEHLHIPLSEEKLDRIRNHIDSREDWRENAEEWIENQELEFTVDQHEYKTGTHRTKYRQSDKVLKPNKSELYMSEEEEIKLEAMKNKYGEADGYAKCPWDVEVGTVYSHERFGLEREREDIRAERRREEELEQIREDHPSLRSVEIEPKEFDHAQIKAEEDGEKVEIAERNTSCNNPKAQCNLDIVTYYVTPDGEIETERIHTH